MGKKRILIVDDAIVVRRMLSDMLDQDEELEVVGTAENGKIALDKIADAFQKRAETLFKNA